MITENENKNTNESIKELTSNALIENTRTLVSDERRVSIEIIKHLREIERRRLYAEWGFSSMFVFCVRELKYSEGAASRRLNSMRVLVEIPEIESDLESGTLQLSTVSQVQSFCFAQKRENGVQITTEEKKAILRTIENRSKRETEQILTAISPKPLTSERQRVLDPEHTEIRIIVGESLIQKLKRLEDLWAHRQKTRSYAELLEMMADQLLDKIDPARKPILHQQDRHIPSHSPSLAEHNPQEHDRHEDAPPLGLRIRGGLHKRTHTSKDQIAHQYTRDYISTGLRLTIWRRDEGKCTYITPQTGQRCGETRALQLDHIQPLAKGGASTLENLRLLCRTHNAQAAIHEFGEEHMKAYLKS